MKKILFTTLLAATSLGLKAQYGDIEAKLIRLESTRGVNKNMKEVDVSNRKFVLIREFDDHTERMFITINGNKATYAEVFDDKANGQSSSNVFSGDVVRTNSNILSFRFDMLEGQKIALPLTKNLLMTMQKNILYLYNVNTKERWIDEASFGKKK